MEPFPACLFFLLAGFTAFSEVLSSAGNNNNLYGEAGSESFTLPLPEKTLVLESDSLIWKRNSVVEYSTSRTENNGFTVNKRSGLVVPASALLVAGQADVYTVEIHDKGGKEKLSMKTTLHLLEKLSTPILSFNCTDKDNAVFNCLANVSQKQGSVEYAWKVKNVEKKLESGKTLRVLRKDFEKSVTCTVSNKAGGQTSNAAKAKCEASASAVWHKIYQDYFWYIVGGGGGGLVLLLFFITVCCVVRARSRRKRRMHTESELRLEWTKQTPRQDQPPTQKKKKKKTGPQSGAPQTHRCKSSHDGARPRNKDTAGAPLAIKDHAAAASSKDPARPRPSPRQPQPERNGGPGVDHGPPLPKPRKKAGAKTHNRARPCPPHL